MRESREVNPNVDDGVDWWASRRQYVRTIHADVPRDALALKGTASRVVPTESRRAFEGKTDVFSAFRLMPHSSQNLLTSRFPGQQAPRTVNAISRNELKSLSGYAKRGGAG
jgi:hypothetical protein